MADRNQKESPDEPSVISVVADASRKFDDLDKKVDQCVAGLDLITDVSRKCGGLNKKVEDGFAKCGGLNKKVEDGFADLSNKVNKANVQTSAHINQLGRKVGSEKFSLVFMYVFLLGVLILSSLSFYWLFYMDKDVRKSVLETNQNTSKSFDDLLKSGDFKGAFSVFNRQTSDAVLELKATRGALLVTEQNLLDRYDSIQKDVAAARKANAELTAASTRAYQKGIDETRELLGKFKDEFNAEISRVNKEMSDLSPQILASSRKDADLLKKDLSKQVDDLKKDIDVKHSRREADFDKTFTKRFEAFEKGLKVVDNGLHNLERTFSLPDSAKAETLLFLVDNGSGVARYQYQEVCDVLVACIGEGVRRTPKRKIGLIAGNNARLTTVLKVDVQYESDLAGLRPIPEGLQVDKNSETDPQAVLDAAISKLALVPGNNTKKVLVYITGDAGNSPASVSDLRKNAEDAKIAVVVIQLTQGAGDGPSAHLASLATETGGEFITINLGRDLEKEKQGRARQMLRRSLLNALGLSEPGA